VSQRAVALSRVPRLSLSKVVLAVGVAAAIAAAAVSPPHAHAAAAQAWAPFVLVAGLLLVGIVAHEDGLFDALAGAADRVPGTTAVLLLALLGVVAVVTVLLNLDTSVAFLTPVLIIAARRRGAAEKAFLYGVLFMSNSASLLLPGSNLTNLLVLAREHVSGALFAARMFPAWVAAVFVTALVVLVIHKLCPQAREPVSKQEVPTRVGPLGVAATIVVALLVLLLQQPALPVLAVGILALLIRRLPMPDVVNALGPAVLIGLFGLAVGLGTLARSWDGPDRLIRTAGGWETAAIGAIASVLVNNLPAAVLFTARRPPHPRALLLGLNLGPNLVVTGSLSALLWYRAARRTGSQPSLATVTRIGIVLVPLSILAAGFTLRFFAPQHL
jgi:arsenical pump membrane protein